MIRLFAAVALAAALAVPAAVAAPPAGVLVPGRSLGGIELGATKAQVERQWGRAYGIRGCARETWYFNYYAFQPRGAGVEWRNDTAAAVFTIYQPLGWRTRKGLGSAIRRGASRRSTGRSRWSAAAATPPTCCAGGGRRPPSTS